MALIKPSEIYIFLNMILLDLIREYIELLNPIREKYKMSQRAYLVASVTEPVMRIRAFMCEGLVLTAPAPKTFMDTLHRFLRPVAIF